MGIFFENTEEKSTKSMIIIRNAIVFLIAILLITGIVNGFNFVFFMLIFIISGVGSILNGIERYSSKKKTRDFLLISLLQ
jgi:hypothetical protein